MVAQVTSGSGTPQSVKVGSITKAQLKVRFISSCDDQLLIIRLHGCEHGLPCGNPLQRNLLICCCKPGSVLRQWPTVAWTS